MVFLLHVVDVVRCIANLIEMDLDCNHFGSVITCRMFAALFVIIYSLDLIKVILIADFVVVILFYV